ncbi:hypothetical protein AB751O23_AI_00250 [Chlamydiales bacterium SCGC AB-751-O23]|jgi:hypothetical protein|nr:hypothetical protein AB751O23_AI_00250 [Chlamydiales bacterium SCGC AB-751-O23]
MATQVDLQVLHVRKLQLIDKHLTTLRNRMVAAQKESNILIRLVSFTSFQRFSNFQDMIYSAKFHSTLLTPIVISALEEASDLKITTIYSIAFRANIIRERGDHAAILPQVDLAMAQFDKDYQEIMKNLVSCIIKLCGTDESFLEIMGDFLNPEDPENSLLLSDDLCFLADISHLPGDIGKDLFQGLKEKIIYLRGWLEENKELKEAIFISDSLIQLSEFKKKINEELNTVTSK